MQYQLHQSLPLLHVLTGALSSVQCYHVCRFMWAALQSRCRWFCHKVPVLPCYSCSHLPLSCPEPWPPGTCSHLYNVVITRLPCKWNDVVYALGLAHLLEIHPSWWVVWVARSLGWLSSAPCVGAPQPVERFIQADSGSGSYTITAGNIPGQVWCMCSSGLPAFKGTPLAARVPLRSDPSDAAPWLPPSSSCTDLRFVEIPCPLVCDTCFPGAFALTFFCFSVGFQRGWRIVLPPPPFFITFTPQPSVYLKWPAYSRISVVSEVQHFSSPCCGRF